MENNNDMKVLACVAVKLENNYIEEWVRYYKNLGVDKIVIFDNNSSDGERITDVPYIKEMAEQGYIIVVPQYNKMGVQTAQFTECYNLFYKDYDWLTFLDVDEYIQLNKHNNIKEFLAQEKFNDFDIIHIQWRIYDDNGYLKIEDGNYSLVSRFTHPLDTVTLLGNTENENRYGYFYHKCIIKGREYKRIRFNSGNTHTPSMGYSDNSLKTCDANGNEVPTFDMAHNKLENPDAQLNHYICKTIEEYMENKMVRFTGALPTVEAEQNRVSLNLFLKYNLLTFEKLQYMHDKEPEACEKMLNFITICCGRYAHNFDLTGHHMPLVKDPVDERKNESQE